MCCVFQVRLEVKVFIIWGLTTTPLEIEPELDFTMQMSAKQIALFLNSAAHYCTEVTAVTFAQKCLK